MRSSVARKALPDDAVIVPAPVMVVEVLSPSTATRDTGAKLADYFRLPSLRHYLIVRTDRPTVIHHRHGDGELIETRIVTSGALLLDPPGITLELERIYG
jgi:Uma2 family endonuclease